MHNLGDSVSRMNKGKIQKHSKLILPLILVILLLNTYSTSYQGLNLNIGDIFNYDLKQYSTSRIINGTNFAQPLVHNQGDKIKVHVDNIGLDAKNNAYVNVTETINTQDFVTSSYVDYWNVTFLVGLLVLAVEIYHYPESVDFSQTSLSVGPGDPSESIIPYFASSDPNYYDNIILYYQNHVTQSSFVTYTIENNKNTNTFNFDLNYSRSQYNITSNSETASSDLSYLYKISIDLSRSIVSHFLFKLDSSVVVGSASKSINIVLEVQEDLGINTSSPSKSITNPFPDPSIFLGISSLFTLALIIDKKRNRI